MVNNSTSDKATITPSILIGTYPLAKKGFIVYFPMLTGGGLIASKLDDLTPGKWLIQNAGVDSIFNPVTIDSSNTPYTKTSINTAYPSARRGDTVVQDAANTTYIKKDDSPTGNWSTFPTIQLT